MITDEEMQKALETVKKYCDERNCLQCKFKINCNNYLYIACPPSFWEIKKDDN